MVATRKGKEKGKKGKINQSKGKSPNNENKDACDNQSDTECFHCNDEGHIARRGTNENEYEILFLYVQEYVYIP